MAEYLIVDGYNIIHAWKSLKSTVSQDLEHARIKLIDMMADYKAFRGVYVIIVFDAHMVKGSTGSKEQISGVEVIYTAEGETADSLIEKIAGEFKDSDRVTVATSDWDQQRIVFGRGAVRLSAKELEADVKASRQEVRSRIEDTYDSDHKLTGQLNDYVKEILEKMRREK